MTTSLKGLQCHVKNPPLSQLRIPTGRRQTIVWLSIKSGEFAPWITEDKSIQ